MRDPARRRAGDRSRRGLEEEELEGAAAALPRALAQAGLLPQLSDVLGPAVEIDDVEGVTVLGVNPPWLPRSSRAVKRAMDLALASRRLAARLRPADGDRRRSRSSSTRRGPLLFRQERVGRGGRRFRLLKFRTMVADAEQRRGRAARPEHRPALAEARARPAHHARRPSPAPPQPRRAAAALERAPRRDEHRRPAAADRGRGRAGQGLGARPTRPHAWDHRAIGRCSGGLGSRSRRWSSSTTSTS